MPAKYLKEQFNQQQLEVYKRTKPRYEESEYKEVKRLPLPPGVRLSRRPDAPRPASSSATPPVRLPRPPSEFLPDEF